MDIASALVALISIAAFTLPFIYLSRVQSKKKKQILDFINAKAAEHKLTLSQMDYWNQQFAIGIDEGKNSIIYFKKSNDTWNEQVINLTDYQKCIIRDRHSKNLGAITNGHGAANLQLVLFPKKPNIAEAGLDFFDRSDSLSLNGEWLLIDKWRTVVTEKMSA